MWIVAERKVKFPMKTTVSSDPLQSQSKKILITRANKFN